MIEIRVYICAHLVTNTKPLLLIKFKKVDRNDMSLNYKSRCLGA